MGAGFGDNSPGANFLFLCCKWQPWAIHSSMWQRCFRGDGEGIVTLTNRESTRGGGGGATPQVLGRQIPPTGPPANS